MQDGHRLIMLYLKEFIFRLENTPAFCIVSHLLAIFIAHGAFRRDFKKSSDSIFHHSEIHFA